MYENELWQVFLQNGQAVAGKGATDDDFKRDSSLLMGNAHIWLWKNSEEGAAILLQKRALTKKFKPGYYHISAGGHIHVDESPLTAAVRETKEELGLTLDPSRLYLVQITRMPPSWRDFAHVYTYELAGDETFSFDDGEVAAVEWFTLAEYQKMAKEAEKYKLVDNGAPYSEALIAAISRQVA